MLFLLLVFMVFLVLVDLVLLELLLNLVDLLIEEAADVGLLFDENLGGLVLDGPDVILDLLMQLVDLHDAVAVSVVKATLGSGYRLIYLISSWSY